MTKNKVQMASAHVKALDEETQTLISDVRAKNSKALRWFFVSWTILFILAITGLYQQNRLASQNKSHIDCIVKLLATPASSGQTRHIANLSTCQIKVSQ